VAKEKLKLEADDAKKFVKANESLGDEQFNTQVEILAKAMDALVVSKPLANEKNSAGPGVAPKQTPKPNAPKQTKLPSPMAKAAEDDAEGKENVDKLNLNDVNASQDVALATTVTDDGVINIQKQIAAYFGVKAEE
jgi:hypothetical protein